MVDNLRLLSLAERLGAFAKVLDLIHPLSTLPTCCILQSSELLVLLRGILLHHGVVERFLSVVVVDTSIVNLLRVAKHVGHAMLQSNVRAVRHA